MPDAPERKGATSVGSGREVPGSRVDMSPRQSLLRTVTLPSVVLVVVFSIGSALLLAYLLDDVHDDGADERATRTAALVRERLLGSTSAGHTDIASFVRVVCVSSEHEILVTSTSGRVRWGCGSARAVASPHRGSDGGRIERDGATWWRSVSPVRRAARCSGCHAPESGAEAIGYVIVDVPLAHAELEGRHQLQATVGAGIGLAVALSVVLALLQVLLVTRPLRRLTVAVERIRAGELHVRVPVERDDEIGRLGRSLNEMSASLGRAKEELDRTYRAELAQSEKLAALGQLFTSIAHELKNQLAGITGALRVLASETPAGDPNHPIIHKVLAKTEKMTSTAVTALEFAKPLTPSVGPVDLADLLDRTLFFVERQAGAQGVTVRKRYAKDLSPAEVDEGLMRQVFLNILLNGVQAMPLGGALEVETRAAGEAAVEVRISDQGVGIASEHRDRIFSPFFSTKPTGTGLGLYVARQAVETQRGEIRVESTPGAGTTFVVRLPAFVPHGGGGGVDVAA
ncbi:MAG: HAMP domain-containing protein [Deltaproteobacteria bacterium]|nr:HAMP domain-containing protein [Deltaproteobacteria bacterium]